MLFIAGKRPVHSESVVSVKLDPQSSRVCLSGSADGTCKIITCYDRDLDKNTDGPFGNVKTSGETLLTFKAMGWVNTVHFSPDASFMCYASKFENLFYFLFLQRTIVRSTLSM